MLTVVLTFQHSGCTLIYSYFNQKLLLCSYQPVTQAEAWPVKLQPGGEPVPAGKGSVADIETIFN